MTREHISKENRRKGRRCASNHAVRKEERKEESDIIKIEFKIERNGRKRKETETQADDENDTAGDGERKKEVGKEDERRSQAEEGSGR